MNALAALLASKKAESTPSADVAPPPPPPPESGGEEGADAAMEEPQEQKKVAKSRWAAVGGAVRTGVQTTLWAKSKRRAEDEEFLATVTAGLESADMSREQFEREFASRMQMWVERKAQQEATLRDRHQEQFYHLRARLKGLEMEASITSAPVIALRRKQQSLLAGKRYAEAFDHMKVRGGGEGEGCSRYEDEREGGGADVLHRRFVEGRSSLFQPFVHSIHSSTRCMKSDTRLGDASFFLVFRAAECTTTTTKKKTLKEKHTFMMDV